jgi:gliding motility-associated-like protein
LFFRKLSTVRIRILYPFILAFLLFHSAILHAAPGDAACTAVLVSSNSNSGPYSNSGFVSAAPNPSCFGGGAKNYFWFTFIASSPTVTIKVNGASIVKSMVALYSASSCAGPFTQLACGNANNINATINYTSLTIGSCYYIIVDGNLNNVGTFSLSVTSSSQPVNDIACNAITLPAPDFCSAPDAFSTVGATPETAAQAGTCFDLTGAINGVWFKFVATAACATASITGGGATGLKRPQVAFLQPAGGICGAASFTGAATACAQAGVGKSLITASATGLAIGQTYYILVDDYGSNTGTFQICFSNKSCSPPIPVNDNCAGAIALCQGQNYIGTTSGSTGNSLVDPGASLWSCSSAPSLDKTLYFTFTTSAANDPVIINILPTCSGTNIPLIAGVFEAVGAPCIAANWASPMVCASGSVTNINAGFTINTGSSLSPNKTYYLVLDVPDPIQCGFSLTISGNKGTNAGVDERLCIDAPAQVLLGASPAGGVWSGNGITGASFNPSLAGLGNTTLTYTANGCVDTKLIRVSGPQVIAATCNNATICEGDSMRLKGNLVAPVASYPTTFNSNTGPISIPDNDLSGISSVINVNGITGVLTASSIASVCLNIAHSWDFDLVIQLKSPSGSTIILSQSQGGDEDNYFNTCFSPSATQTIIGAPPSFLGSFLPLQPFANLNGIINGNWELIVKDTRSSDIGQLLNWSITFNEIDTISSFSWSPAGSILNYGNTLSPIVNPNATTVYTLTSTDLLGCTNTSTVTVNVNPRPYAGPDVTLCSGVNGNLFVSSVPGYTYAWSPITGTSGLIPPASITNPVINITSIGPPKKQKYKVVCTAPPGSCTVTDTVEVTVFSLPTATTTNIVKKLCDDGSSTYGVTVNLTGIAPWTIKHCLNGVPDSTITTFTSPYVFLTKTAGVHTFCSVTDSTGCTGTVAGSATVTLVPEITVSNIIRTCNLAQTTYVLQFDISGGDPASLGATPLASGVITCPVAPCPPNNRRFTSNPITVPNAYSIDIGDNVCAHIENVAGNFACNCPATATITGDTTICPGGTATIRIKLTGTGPWTIKYNKNGVLQPTVNFAGPGTTYSFTTTTPGLFVMQSINDANCAGSTSGSAQVLIQTQPTASISASSASICQGDSSQITINFTGTSPFQYQYTGSGPSQILPIGNSLSFYVKNTTALSMVAASDNYCPATLSGNANVIMHLTPTVTLSTSNDTICAGSTTNLNFAFTPIPTVALPTTMNWFNGTANVPFVPAINSTPKVVNSIVGGTYYSNLITDAFGCTSSLSDTVNIVELPIPAATLTLLSNDSICSGSFATFQISVTGAGPWSVKYKRPIGPDTTVSFAVSPYIFQSSQSGAYNLVQVKDDATGCIGTISGAYTIVVNPLPTAIVTGGGTACAGTNVPVTITFTGTSPWSLIYQDNSATNVVVPNQVVNPLVLNYSSVSNFTFNVLSVDDANHCSNGSPNGVPVTIHTLPTATVIGGDSLCDGTTAYVTINFTGVQPFDFIYDSTAGPGGTLNITNWMSNTYTIPVSSVGTWFYKITNITDGNNCSNAGTGLARIVIHPNPTGNISVAQPHYCFGDTAKVIFNFTGTGPWKYFWDQGTILQNNSSANPYIIKKTPPGVYHFQFQTGSVITDKNGCVGAGTGMADFTIHTLPTASVSGTDSACFGNTKNVRIALTGSAPWYITYDSTGTGTTKTIKRYSSIVFIPVTAIGTWTYNVTQIADSFCVNTASGIAKIKIWALPSANMTGGGKICTGQNDTINVTCTGQGPWNFTIRNITTGTNFAVTNYTGAVPYVYYTAVPGDYVIINLTDKKCAGVCNDTVNIVFTARPTALFSAQNVCFNQQMSFVNSSITAGPIPPIWQWNFGTSPASTSSLQTPTNLYAAAQAYVVTLKVDVNGCRDSISKTVHVHPLPNVSYSVLPLTPALVGQNVSFTNSSSIGSGSIASYSWDLGDGTLPTTTNVIHAYSGCNTYNTSLTALSDSGCSASAAQVVNVGEPPVADFTAPNQCLGFATSFTNNSVIAPCNINSTIVSYDWNFGLFPGTNSTLANPTYTYPSAGIYNVRLIVTSNYGYIDTVIKPVTVYPKPIADFSATDVCFGLPNVFTDLSVSTDPITYSWTASSVGAISTIASPSYQFPAVGNYTVQLIVETANLCKDTVQHPVEVYPNPVADFTVADLCVLQQGQFTDNSTISAGTINHNWNFGDFSLNSSLINPLHTYVTSGTYTVLLTVTSNHTCKDTTAKTVLVKSKPTADFSNNKNEGCAPLCVDFTDLSVNLNGPVSGWEWDFGDNTALSNVTNPTHCYTVAGTYTVKLKASSNLTCADEKIKTNLIIVHPVPIADFRYSPDPATSFTSEIRFSNETSGGTQWQWDFDYNLETSIEANPVYFYPADTAVYLVQLIAINTDGCSDTIVKPVVIGPDYSFYAPNSFTPNGDGNNETFRIFGEGIQNFAISIYNRMGQLVYTSTNYKEGWNGNYFNVGYVMQQEVYVYEVKIEDTFGQTHNYKGSITLVR